MEKRNIIIKILFALGIIAIVLLVVFGILKVVPKIVSSLASAGSALGNKSFNQESININTSVDELESGDEFTLSFEHINPSTKDGVYALIYECQDATSLQVIGVNNVNQTLICNRPFTLSSEPIAIEMVAFLANANNINDAKIIVTFTPTGEKTPTVRGEKIVTIQNSNNIKEGDLATGSVTITTDYQSLNNRKQEEDSNMNESPTPPTNTGNTNQNPPRTIGGGSTTPIYRAPADLAISNMRSNGTRVQFTISNIGGRATGVWSFNYTLPTNPVALENSGSQVSLNPGEALGFTLDIADTRGFTSGLISIFADPYNQVTESTLVNNNSSTIISFSNNGNGGNTGGNGNFNPNDDADLVITRAEAGYISGNRFIGDDTIDEDDDGAVQFTVRNEGGENTGTWRFKIDLPTSDNETFRSGRQRSLAPGASITFTVEFDNLERGNNQDIDIEIDSDDDVDEENERNNRRNLEIDIR